MALYDTNLNKSETTPLDSVTLYSQDLSVDPKH